MLWFIQNKWDSAVGLQILSSSPLTSELLLRWCCKSLHLLLEKAITDEGGPRKCLKESCNWLIFLKAEVTLIKSILEQYCQLFSEYSESPVLFSKLEQRTNKTNLSPSTKPSISSWRRISGYLIAWTFWARLHQMVKLRVKSSSAMVSCPFPVTNWLLAELSYCQTAALSPTELQKCPAALQIHVLNCSFGVRKWRPVPPLT